MKRREFITLLGGAAAARPLAARAQQPRMPVVGFLNGASAGSYATFVAAFRQGLNETGYTEGRNIAIEFRWADGRYDRLPALLADLVERRVDVLAVTTTPAVLAAKAAPLTIPIVFTTSIDPVQHGLVTSLSRPGGNITGITQLNVEVAPKRLELVHELAPAGTTIALLVNPTNPIAMTMAKDLQATAVSLGRNLHIVHASAESDFDAVFASLVEMRASTLMIGAGDPFFNSRAERLGALSLRYAVPTIYQGRAFATAGGLMGYGGRIEDAYYQSGIYCGRILKGERPADLPVQQSTKVELIINLKTAKTLGITVPLPLLGRADEVIE